MGLMKPPRHRVDAQPIYVEPGDDAWDREKLAEDFKRMAEAGVEDVHPVPAYWAGTTRFDLNAPVRLFGEDRLPTEWLDEDKDPWRFNLRRLEFDQYHKVAGMVEKEMRALRASAPGVDEDKLSPDESMLRACRYVLVSIDGKGAPKLTSSASGELSHHDMQQLFALNPFLPCRIGKAGWIASQPLTRSEKKA